MLFDFAPGMQAAGSFDALRKRRPRRKRLFASGACDRTRPLDKATCLDFAIEIVRRSDRAADF